VVQETLILNLPDENYEKEFATFVNWARYGDLFAYDETTGQISLQGDVHSLVTLADTPPGQAEGRPAAPATEPPPAR
jgi:hypothetical protein